MTTPIYDYGRFWCVTQFGIFLYWHTGYKTVARFNVTKQEAIEWEERMTAKEKTQNGQSKKGS
jgi:hypothetical protein